MCYTSLHRLIRSHFAAEHFHILNSYSRATRIIWNEPYKTHKYIAEALAKRHIGSNLLTNSLGFYTRLLPSMKAPLSTLRNLVMDDIRTTTGIKSKVSRDRGVDLGLSNQEDFFYIDTQQLKQAYKFAPVLEGD